jgi:hypothetical protein
VRLRSTGLTIRLHRRDDGPRRLFRIPNCTTREFGWWSAIMLGLGTNSAPVHCCPFIARHHTCLYVRIPLRYSRDAHYSASIIEVERTVVEGYSRRLSSSLAVPLATVVHWTHNINERHIYESTRRHIPRDGGRLRDTCDHTSNRRYDLDGIRLCAV